MLYNLIYADPPWQYRDKANAGKRGACHNYPVMTLADIKALPVASLADTDYLLAMWWTPPMAPEAIQRRRYSEKPAEARDRLVHLMGDVPRVELFARHLSPVWQCWGNEIMSTFDLV